MEIHSHCDAHCDVIDRATVVRCGQNACTQTGEAAIDAGVDDNGAERAILLRRWKMGAIRY